MSPSHPIESFISHVSKLRRPGYLYIESELVLSAQTLRRFWNSISIPGFHLLLSLKANPNPHLIKCLDPWLDGFDVSSRAEAQLLLNLGIDPVRLTWSGPAKTDLAIIEMIQAGIGCVHIDSFDELKAIQAAEQKLKLLVRKSIRLQVSEGPNRKLGFSKAELEHLKNYIGPKFSGMHCYLGRESFSLETLENIVQYAQQVQKQIPMIENFELYLGPGLPSRPIIESEFLTKQWPPPAKFPIHLECGRALTQSAGYYFTRVLALKQSAESTRIIIDGGLQHTASHLKSPRFQKQGLEVQFWRDGKKLPAGQKKTIIQGSLSLWYDTLMDEVFIPDDLKRGDIVVFNQCGSYGFSAACNQFIGPTPVQEWLATSDGKLVNISAENLCNYQNASESIDAV